MKEKIYTLDFTGVRHFLEVHYIIKASLGFPDYYGNNWSAFRDCLGNLEEYPMRIKIIGLDELRRSYSDMAERLIEILGKFKYSYPAITDQFTVEIIREDGERELL